MDKAQRDQHSRDVSDHKLVEKLTHKGVEIKQDWSHREWQQYAQHVFTIEGSKHVYWLFVYADQSMKALRHNPEHPMDTPRTLSPEFAKLLYMKVWPDVGI